MSAKTCLYDVLSVSRDADTVQIKKSYRKLAMKWHPDRMASASEEQQKEADERFREIAFAYEVLSDDARRSIYDRRGFEGLEEGNGPSRASDVKVRTLDDILGEIDVSVSEETARVRPGARRRKGNFSVKFGKKKEAGNTDASAEVTPETSKSKQGEDAPKKGFVMIEEGLRDKFVAFARAQGNDEMADQLARQKVQYGSRFSR